MSIRKYVALLSFFVCVAANSALAHDAAPTYDRINFQVSASEEIENDTLVAVMYYERSGQQPTAMADDVNRTIEQAVATAKENDAIKVQTLNYRQEPLYKNQTVTGWRVRQSIRLESTDVAALGTLIGELQKRLSVASLSYAVSPEVRARVEDTLITHALGRFAERGKLIAAELGRPDYRIVGMDVATARAAPGPVRMRAVASMAESSGVAPPSLEAGVQTITVQVSGTIELEVPR
jgi:predicted secreted protein